MTDGQYRLRVKLGAGEFEGEGSEEFIKRFWEKVQPLIEGAAAYSQSAPSQELSIASAPKSNGKGVLPQSFGEYRDTFGKLTDTDEVFVAGHFLTQGRSNPVFTGNEARDLLKKHGVNIAHPSGLISNLLKSKKVFRDDETNGVLVSKKGNEYITELQSKA